MNPNYKETYVMPAFADTLCDKIWLNEHAPALRRMLPETWTHIQNINIVALGYQLKLIGIDWRSQQDLAGCLAVLEKAGLLLRDGLLLRRST